MHNVLFSAAGTEFRDNLLPEIKQVQRQTLLQALTAKVLTHLKTPQLRDREWPPRDSQQYSFPNKLRNNIITAPVGMVT